MDFSAARRLHDPIFVKRICRIIKWVSIGVLYSGRLSPEIPLKQSVFEIILLLSRSLLVLLFIHRLLGSERWKDFLYSRFRHICVLLNLWWSNVLLNLLWSI